MGLFDWLKRGGPREDARLAAWRAEWTKAAEAGETAAVERLRGTLDAMGLPEDDVEVEREMLDGLGRLGELSAEIAAAGLPIVTTGHRAVGHDRCHFSAPVSMPDEPAQPTGRLLLTGARALFVGGASGTAVAWHAVGEVLARDRDLVLVRRDRARLYRFRCNSYADALSAALLARHITARR